MLSERHTRYSKEKKKKKKKTGFSPTENHSMNSFKFQTYEKQNEHKKEPTFRSKITTVPVALFRIIFTKPLSSLSMLYVIDIRSGKC